MADPIPTNDRKLRFHTTGTKLRYQYDVCETRCTYLCGQVFTEGIQSGSARSSLLLREVSNHVVEDTAALSELEINQTLSSRANVQRRAVRLVASTAHGVARRNRFS